MRTEVETIGSSGQISLGKEYAGRTVLVEEIERGYWQIRTARIVPDTEAWIEQPAVRESLDRALAHSDKTKRTETNPKGAGEARQESVAATCEFGWT